MIILLTAYVPLACLLQEIHELLLAFAEAGASVIRLKGGDPYVFGRGGEEVQFLMARGIRVHCVPGITAAAGEQCRAGTLNCEDTVVFRLTG